MNPSQSLPSSALFVPAAGSQATSLLTSISPIDTQLALSTFFGIAGYWAINKLSSDTLCPNYSAVLSYIPPVAMLVNQIWKQTLVSQLPIKNRLLQIAVSPWTLLATYALTKMSAYASFEWPTAIATAYVIGLNSLHKSAVALHNHHYVALPLHLFTAIGTALQTLATLGILPITGNNISNNDYWKKLKALEEKEKADLEKTNAELDAKLKEKLEEIDREAKKTRIAARREKKRFENILSRNVDCPEVDPKAFQNMSYLDRATHKDLNPVCPEHAKIILAPVGGDAQSINEKECESVIKMAKPAKCKTHPDANLHNTSVATRAFETVVQALETICPTVSEE